MNYQYYLQKALDLAKISFKKGRVVMKKIVIEQINQAKQWSEKIPVKTIIETTKTLQTIETICRE